MADDYPGWEPASEAFSDLNPVYPDYFIATSASLPDSPSASAPATPAPPTSSHCATCEKMANEPDDGKYRDPDRFGQQGEERKDPDPDLFSSLPLELHEMIYDLVSGDERTVHPSARRDFDNRENYRKRRMKREFPNVFAESFFCQMLVNKQYLEEAARVWIRTKTFAWSSGVDLDTGFERMSSWEKYLMLSITSVKLTYSKWHTCFLSKMPNLSRVEIGLQESDFESVDADECPWKDDFTDAEIAANDNVVGILKIRGLRNMKINWRSNYNNPNTVETDKFNAFKLQVESLVDDVVHTPRDQIDTLKTALSFEEALRKDQPSADAPNKVNTPEASSAKPEVPTLTDDEVPETEDKLLRKFLLQPRAMVKWIKETKKKLKAAR